MGNKYQYCTVGYFKVVESRVSNKTDATSSRHLVVVRAASGPDSVERRTPRGQTPLFLAVEQGLMENASLLLTRGSQPDTQDHEQDSPLLL
ncbi:putative ankyrin repeat and SOCS box protein 14, partial [Scophthalmus maximus]